MDHPINSQALQVLDWGLIDYELALQKQLELVDEVYKNNLVGFIVFCSHPPVVTLGRKTQAQDITFWSGKTIEVSRGGRATYHGPSQVVVYPVVNLNFDYNYSENKDAKNKDFDNKNTNSKDSNNKETSKKISRPYHDINKFLRNLEEALILTLGSFGISTERKSYPDTGIWITDKNSKIASLGIAVKNWVTYHGAAVNITNDPVAFQGMSPCGWPSSVMTNLESLLKNIHSTKVSDLAGGDLNIDLNINLDVDLMDGFKIELLKHIHWIG